MRKETNSADVPESAMATAQVTNTTALPGTRQKCKTELGSAMWTRDRIDSLPEPCFDRLTRVAAHVFKCPFACLVVSEGGRLLPKSCYGPSEPADFSRVATFCSRFFRTDRALAIPDTLANPRLADGPAMSGTELIRFYADAPLITEEGCRIGTLCVFDSFPHSGPHDCELEILRDLAAEAMDHVEYRSIRCHLAAYAEALERRNREFLEYRRRWSKSEATATLALEAGEMGHWEWNAATERCVWSPRMERIFGMEPGSYDGSHACWLRCLHPENRSQIEEEVRQLRQNGAPFVLKYRIVHPTGGVRWVIEQGSYQHDNQGKLLGAIGVCYDATARENTLHELCASEELFRGLSASSPVGIFRAAMEGSVTYVNPRTATIFDMTETELLGVGWLSRVHPEDRDTLISDWAKANSVRRNYDCEYRLLLPDKRVRWVHGRSAIVYGRDGTAVGTVGTIDDITDRKQAERALREAKVEAESANRAKDLFLANVSHELRTPLNGILGMAELLLQSPLSGEQKECAEAVHHSGETLLAVVNDILDISKIDAGAMRIEAAPFDLRVVVDRAASVIRSYAAKKGLRVSIDFPDTFRSRFVGDSARIRQILLNFLTNAVKFTDQGGITCEVRIEELDGRTRRVTIAVHDTGCGIPKASQAKLFQPFTQIDPSSTRRHGGVGLGLAISRRLAELMSGAVGVISTPDEGSTFWLKLELPLADSR